MMFRLEPKFERSVRLVLSLALLGAGAFFLSKGYDAAYLGKEDERPSGNSEQWAYYLLATFAWIVGLYWGSVRVASWAFTLFFAWWCYSTVALLISDRYYVMGLDGCLPCGNQKAILYFGVSLIGLFAGVFALIFRIQTVNDWRIVAGMVLTVAWGMGLFLAI